MTFILKESNISYFWEEKGIGKHFFDDDDVDSPNVDLLGDEDYAFVKLENIPKSPISSHFIHIHQISLIFHHDVSCEWWLL